MIRILSTKKLQSSQKQFLLNAGLSVVEGNFIGITNNEIVLSKINDFLIFTSQNAVSSVLQNEKAQSLKNKKCFCVGSKTKKLLEENGFEVIETSDYAQQLGEKIAANYQSQNFTFFSGNLRHETLPQILKDNNVEFNEIEVYETSLNPMKINSTVNAILFFSPSAVDSYLKQNEISDQTCFCIGTTTAKALQNRTENIIIANQQTVENVIIQCINHYKSHELL